jgi:hypothetical protein
MEIHGDLETCRQFLEMEECGLAVVRLKFMVCWWSVVTRLDGRFEGGSRLRLRIERNAWMLAIRERSQYCKRVFSNEVLELCCYELWKLEKFLSLCSLKY